MKVETKPKGSGLGLTVRWSLAGTAVLMLVAGCSGATDTVEREGRIAGQLSTTDGAAPGETRPIRGSVMLEDDSGAWQSVEVGSDGRFNLWLSVGTYSVKEISCGGDAEVTVVEGKSSTVDVICPDVLDQR